MRTEKEIKDLYSIFSRLNERRIFNQDYRDGVMDALAFVLIEEESITLAKLKKMFVDDG